MSDFPINTKTSCQLKWAWSTLYLNTGVTRSCHRTAESVITVENFSEFHNTPVKIKHREDMLDGQWPSDGCDYCRQIEESGGTSDRIRQINIPYVVPPELKENPFETYVTPTLLEVFFSNVCNLGCLYCHPTISSVNNNENKKFGAFPGNNTNLTYHKNHYAELDEVFWQWFDNNYQTLSRFHYLGGEPFYQEQFYQLLDKFEQLPNPNCEFNIVSNLNIPQNKLKTTMERLKVLVTKRHIKRVDITCSLDCLGPQQEYVRWGLDVDKWIKNFEYLLTLDWLVIHLNQTITPLTIKTMPGLLEKLSEWRKIHKIGHFFSGVAPGPEYLKLHVLGGEIFKDDFKKILSLMPEETDEDKVVKEYMKGISKDTWRTGPHHNDITNLFEFLNEKDRRRGTNWKLLFPWLVDFEQYIKYN